MQVYVQINFSLVFNRISNCGTFNRIKSMSLLQTELNDITCTYHDLLNNEHFCLFTKTPLFPLDRTYSCDTYVRNEYFTLIHIYVPSTKNTIHCIQYAHIKHNKNCKNRHIVIIDRNRIHRTCEMNENDYQLKCFAMDGGVWRSFM